MRRLFDHVDALEVAIVAALLAALLGLAACGSSDPNEGDAGASADSVGDGSGGFRAEPLGAFKEPIYMTGAPGADGLLFVVERSGVIRLVEDDQAQQGSFLDIRSEVRSKPGGLLSVAFPPDFAASGLFYVFFTDEDGNSRVEEYRRSDANPRTAEADSGRTVIRIEKPADAEHNGGQLQFGPDGYLYISTGDGGGAGDPDDNAQDRNSLLGKILRIDPKRDADRPYAVPADNPFVGKPGRDEIYALGLRNPWRFSFDRASGALVIADVGQSTLEEVDYARSDAARGANFGWDAFEGSGRFRSPSAGPPPGRQVEPIYEYRHDDDNCAIIGGYVSRDPRIESLYGRYLYADFCKGDVRSLIPRVGGAEDDRSTGLSGSGINTFGEGADGRIYFASIGGEVFAINPG